MEMVGLGLFKAEDPGVLCVVGKNNSLPKMTMPKNPEPDEYVVTWQGGIKIADRIKATNQLTLN